MNFKDNTFFHTFIYIFRVKREERLIALLMFVAFLSLDALVLCNYYDVFTPFNKYYWHLFVSKFHISGFDPITYSIVSDWTSGYNVYRHPLLAYFMYVPYLVNQGLMWLTGINCAIFVVAAIQLFCSFYSSLFLYRIFREIVGIGHRESCVLLALYFGFAYIMLTTMVPDHFVISQMLLLLALYVSGKLMMKHRQLTIWQSVLYFFLTAGTSLNNGLKIYLSQLFVNGWRIFRPKYLFVSILLPAALIWGTARLTYDYIVWPHNMAAKAARAKAKAAKEKKRKAEQAAKWHDDSLRIAAFTPLQRDSLSRDSVQRDSVAKAKAKQPKPKRRIKNGKPIANGEFIGWTDITTSRSESIVENLFGEAIQLHQDYLLGDVLRSRPMIVHYRHAFNYVVEGFIAALFLLGIWAGRKKKFLWLVMSYFALDMMLHVVLGFAINEVYIMSAHWMYVVPVAMAYLISGMRNSHWRHVTIGLVSIVAIYLWIWNVSLIVNYLFG